MKLPVYARLPEGTLLFLEVDQSDTVSALIKEIESQTGVHGIRLILNGVVLGGESQEVAECGVYSECVIDVDFHRLIIGENGKETADGYIVSPQGLLLYSKLGNSAAVSALLEYGIDPNCRNSSGESPLHLSVMRAHYNVVELLLQHNCDAKACDAFGNSPLYLACEHSHPDIISLLLSSGIPCRLSHLVLGVSQKNREVVDVLLRYTDHLQETDLEGHNALHYAVDSREMSVVKSITEAGCPVDVPSRTGVTPLLASCERGCADIASYLLQHGANPHHKNANKANAITSSVGTADSENLVIMLLKLGVDPNVPDSRADASPLMLSCQMDDRAVTRCLISMSPDLDVNFQNSSGNTSLMEVAASGREATAHILLTSPSLDLDIRNNAGKTALHIAAERGHISVLQLLLSKGANPGVKTLRGVDPLLLAVRNNQVAAAEVMHRHLEKKSDDGCCVIS
eukprot:TRINITY_DN9061_c1_g1_i1.p1 TRINITY_DN9061_c1_g1~~TRINITY_DN9061_c1_g1_i1.p1  ORF type:complete len:456 (+),score=81.23 TRINITY_DN9061_c1_g1_i1:41-1408(+)